LSKSLSIVPFTVISTFRIYQCTSTGALPRPFHSWCHEK